MKIALVHELLTMRGGAERVLRIIADMFPEAPIYTLLYNEAKLGAWFPRHRVRPSIIHRSLKFRLLPHFQLSLPVRQAGTFNFQFRFNHHLYLSQFPSAVEAWDFSEFDLVISTSSACAHGIITNGKPKHLCYVHSPARYLWDRTHDVLERAGQGLFGGLKRRHLEKTFHRLRIWDTESAERPDALLAASKEVQRRIELYWLRESTVLTPPINDFWFQIPLQDRSDNRIRATEAENISRSRGSVTPAYLIVSTLAAYKKIDLAIAACNQKKIPLRIVGEGPDRKRLERLAGPTIQFLGYKQEAELPALYASAKATLFPGEEDFGLVPLESLACGTPVIAYAKGGALETLEEGMTGTFFSEPSADSLEHAMDHLNQMTFDLATLRNHAKKFSRQKFEQQLREQIRILMR